MPIKDFPFLSLSRDDPKRPWLPIKINNSQANLSIFSYGLIDTGADDCAIPADYAGQLNHDLLSVTPKIIGSAGGEARAYPHTTKIEIYNHQNELIYALPEIHVDFIVGLEVPLLGVKEFLDNFVLNVDYPRKVFSIQYP